MKYQAVYENEIYEQTIGPAIVVKYHGSKKVDIKFVNTGTLLTVTAQQSKKGSIEDNMAPRMLGVGYHGFGPYKGTEQGKLTKPYTLWYDMLNRCYNVKLHSSKHSTYVGVTVCEEWHNFQNFAKWLEQNYVEGWALDKDLIGGNIFSPQTCVYTPTEVNMAEAHLRKAKNENPEFSTRYDEFVKSAIRIYKH